MKSFINRMQLTAERLGYEDQLIYTFKDKSSAEACFRNMEEEGIWPEDHLPVVTDRRTNERFVFTDHWESVPKKEGPVIHSDMVSTITVATSPFGLSRYIVLLSELLMIENLLEIEDMKAYVFEDKKSALMHVQFVEIFLKEKLEELRPKVDKED